VARNSHRENLQNRVTELDGKRRLAELISAVLGAPIVALYSFAFLITDLNPPSIFLLVSICCIFGSILPIAILYCLAKRGIIADIYASERSSRPKAFTGVALSYFLGIVVLMMVGAPPTLVALMACYTINLIALMLISQYWKVSVHASGITAPATFLATQMGIIMLPFFLLLLPVAWARIKLKAHTPTQIAVGATLAVFLTLIQMGIYLR